MRPISRPHLLLALALAALLAACAALGIPDTDTFNKRVAAGYTTVEASADGATALLAAGKIDDKERRYVVSLLNAAIDGLDAASALGKTDLQAGQARLNAALVALTSLQVFLTAKGAP